MGIQDKHEQASALKNEAILSQIAALKKPAFQALKKPFGHLNVIPAAAIKLIKLTNESDASFRELSQIIETEPSLSLEVLKLVNSAYYALPQKINVTQRAVTLLGFSRIRQLALSLLFFKKLGTASRAGEFNPIQYWLHSLFVAELSKSIAGHINHPDPDRLYSVALLHDIGKMVLEDYGKITYSQFLENIAQSEAPTLENEKRFFGINHAELGGVICHECGLPDDLAVAVFEHHTVSTKIDFHDRDSLDSALIAFSDMIAKMQGLGISTHSHFSGADLQVLNLIDKLKLNIEEILVQVDERICGLSQFYNISFPSVQKLRANLVESLFKFGAKQPGMSSSPTKNQTSLTTPHHSLDPDVFIPSTLKAINDDFGLERSMVFCISAETRSLVFKYLRCSGEGEQDKTPAVGEIAITSLPPSLLELLRKKQSRLVDGQDASNMSLLKQLHSRALLAVPIVANGRLWGLLLADNVFSHKPLDELILNLLDSVANELAIAVINAMQFEHERKRAQCDPLTGLNNKRMVDEYLLSMFSRPAQERKGLVVGFIDVDHFKNFNDTYGHQAGDDVLKITADTLKSLSRPGDFVGRFGGEEFVFVLTGSNKQGAEIYSERIRLALEQRGVLLQKRFSKQSLTVSIGVALYNENFTSHQDMLEAADQAMYLAKKNGRNQVVIYQASTSID